MSADQVTKFDRHRCCGKGADYRLECSHCEVDWTPKYRAELAALRAESAKWEAKFREENLRTNTVIKQEVTEHLDKVAAPLAKELREERDAAQAEVARLTSLLEEARQFAAYIRRDGCVHVAFIDNGNANSCSNAGLNPKCLPCTAADYLDRTEKERA